MIRLFLARLAGLFRGKRFEQDLEAELQFHFEREVELHMSRGLSEKEAKLAARRRFGGIARAKEACRDARGFPVVERLFRDLLYGARMLRRSPGFTAAAVLSLGLGIGVNCAVFTLTNATLLKHGFKDPDRLALIWISWKGRLLSPPYPTFRQLVDKQQSFSELAAAGNIRPQHFVYDGAELQELNQVEGDWVSANYFQMLGVDALLGRIFTPQDSSQPGEGSVILLRYGFWRAKFAGDPSVIGRTVVVNGVPLAILGVMPPEFSGHRQGQSRDFWIPILMQARFAGSGNGLLDSHTASWFATLGRLKPGVTVEQANLEMTNLLQPIIAEQNAAGIGSRMSRPEAGDIRGDVRAGPDGLSPARARRKAPLFLLTGVAALVLLIACCNVANLLLARGATRRHEIGTRLALGCSRTRLAWQLLTESLLLSILGGVAGLALLPWATRFLMTLSAGILPSTIEVEPDGRVLLFTAAVALFSTLLFGVLPAWQAASKNAVPFLSGARAAVTRFRQHAIRSLVVIQVALSLTLLSGAGLMIRSLQNLRSADIGLDRRHVAAFEIAREADQPETAYAAVREEMTARLRSMPGVRQVTFSTYGIFAGGGLTAPGRSLSRGAPADREVLMGYVAPGFFDALGIELLLGRDISEADASAPANVAVISEFVAKHYFGNRSPLGESLYFPGIDNQGRYIPFSEGLDRARRVEIVGVVRDTRERGPRQEPGFRIYLPLSDRSGSGETLYVRTEGDPKRITASVLGLAKEFAPTLRLEGATTVEERLGFEVERLGARLLSAFGILALILATVGLYGVMAYAVTRRTSEIGVRMALGAQRGSVLRMVLRETLALMLAGIAVGIPAAIAATRLLESALFGLEPGDPATIATVTAILLAVALSAGYIPARRASAVDPVIALRHD
jgi:predicted permease